MVVVVVAVAVAEVPSTTDGTVVVLICVGVVEVVVGVVGVVVAAVVVVVVVVVVVLVVDVVQGALNNNITSAHNKLKALRDSFRYRAKLRVCRTQTFPAPSATSSLPAS